MERYRRGKTHRARTGSVNVLGGAPFGYRYLAQDRRTPAPPTRSSSTRPPWWPELFRRYTDDGASIADLTRWLTEQRHAHPHRQDPLGPQRGLGHAAQPRLRRAGGLRQDHGRPRVRRASTAVARLEGRTTPRAVKTVDRPREEWIAHPGPGHHHPRDLRTGRRSGWPTTSASPPATARSPPCCRAWPPARAADTATTAPRPAPPTRRSTTTGAWARDDYRYEGGRVCANKPVRADYLDQVVWDHITGLLADPHADPRRDRQAPRHAPAPPTPPPASANASSWRWPRPPPRSPA